MFEAAVTALIALITGIVSSMLGIGGGIILVPTFNLLIGLPIRRAIGTTKFLILFTSTSSALAHYRYRRIDWKTGLLLELTAIPGSILGVNLVQILDPKVLKIILAIALVMASINMMRGRKGREVKMRINGIWPRRIVTCDGMNFNYAFSPARLAVGLIFGFIAGLIAGVTGLGGGIVKVPLLNLILEIPIHVATATSSFMIMLTSPPTALIHAQLGHIDYIKGFVAIPGILIGTQIGGKVVGRVKARELRRMFAFLLLFVAIRMIYDAIKM